MATRLYLGNTAYTANTPAFSTSAWNGSTSADRCQMTGAKDGSAMSNKATPSQVDWVNRQYVSDPLQNAFSFSSGTCSIKGQVRTQANGTGSNLTVLIRVFSGDGLTARGTLLNGIINSTATTTTMQNRKLNNGATAISTVNAQAGDRIVMEIGFTTGSARIMTNSFGGDNATDLPEDNTTTTANNPWIEFSANLVFQGSTPLINHNALSCMGCG